MFPLNQALSKLQQKFLQMPDESSFKLALLKRLGERKEVEDVRVFQGLARKVRLR